MVEVPCGSIESKYFADGKGTLPEKPVLLSFDDGYYNNYKYVFPLLQKYGMKIVMSVIAGATDEFTRRPSLDENYAHITLERLTIQRAAVRVTHPFFNQRNRN